MRGSKLAIAQFLSRMGFYILGVVVLLTYADRQADKQSNDSFCISGYGDKGLRMERKLNKLDFIVQQRYISEDSMFTKC